MTTAASRRNSKSIRTGSASAGRSSSGRTASSASKDSGRRRRRAARSRSIACSTTWPEATRSSPRRARSPQARPAAALSRSEDQRRGVSRACLWVLTRGDAKAGRTHAGPLSARNLPLGAEEEVLLLHSLGLAGGELEVAGIVRVVHEVVDRIESRFEAGVPADLAPERRPLLGGRVGDVVALRVTTALERVVEAEPVAGLVRSGEPRL